MTRPIEMTWEAFFRKHPGEPVEVLRARHAEDVAWAEAQKNDPSEGPPIRIRISRGRPPIGEEAPVQLKGLKMPKAFWAQMEDAARASGLNLHAAMREAVIQWTLNHRSNAG